ncbi:transposase [Flavobacterium sp. SORGH_AS_0622]|uniref:transposase n=1 Tax=Flavobacterium sp. SORGH_AS_0622 TaxID=3041772 RepID=UPI00277E3002|nr:transposase [Flavobacterium sp. SORGH_AS_0622]MDQ1164573.1 hypothetical protein [Flavobacterium sp. SORGH_AS_0622]
MSTKYKATTTEDAYFITITVVGWIDIFTRLSQKNVLINALKILSDIIRDFKKFTSKKIIQTIIGEPESRREWILEYFQKSCEHLKKEQTYKIWQNGYHAEHIYSNKFIKQKIDYIHNNPIKDKTVSSAEDYYFSSARNYTGLENDLDVVLLNLF